MKKMFTLMLLSTMLLSAQAQQTEERNNNLENDGNEITAERPGSNYGNNRNSHAYNMLERQRDREIDRINREYDRDVQRVWNNFFLSRLQKQRLVRELEEDRRFEIRQTEAIYQRKLNRLRKYGSNYNF